MKRKRLLLIVGCLAAVLLAGYATFRLTAPRHRITIESFQAIREGMTELEVEAVLGAPAGVYSTEAQTGFYLPKLRSSCPARWIYASDADFIGTGSDLIERQGGKEWVGEELSIYICFNEGGRVLESRSGQVPPTRNESFLAKLRRWLGI